MYNLGIDLGGTNIKAGIVDENNAVIFKSSVPTGVADGNEAVVENIVKACAIVLHNAEITLADIENIGIGTPGAVNSGTGVVERAENMRFENFPLAAKLEEKINRKVYIENDANAAALGEYVAGAAKGAKNAVCVTLGTGVGGGIIIDGRLYSGANYAGGELGHTVINFDGKHCNCGRNGCWERYASVTALIEQTKTAMEENADSALWKFADGSIENVNGKTAFDAMRAGDKVGTAVVDKFIGYISCGITNMVNIFQPDVICIGGAISKEGDYILTALKKLVEKERFTKENTKQSEIVMATLENDAGIIGAANLYKAN